MLVGPGTQQCSVNSSCQSNWGDSLGTGVITVQGAFRLARQPVWLERGEEGGRLGWRGLGPGGWDWTRRGLLVPKGHRERRKGASEAEVARPGRGWGSSASHGVSDECQMFH